MRIANLASNGTKVSGTIGSINVTPFYEQPKVDVMKSDQKNDDYASAQETERATQLKKDRLLDKLGSLNVEREKARQVGNSARLDSLNKEVHELHEAIFNLEYGR